MSEEPPQLTPKIAEVWLANTHDDPHAPRHTVVVSANSQNMNLDWVVIVPCSTSLAEVEVNADYHVFLPAGEGGLSKDCHARCELIASLRKERLIRKLGGPIGKKYHHAIISGVKRTLGEYTDVIALYQENIRLKKRIEELEGQ